MNKATEIKAPPIRLFGNYLLLQGIQDVGNRIVIPSDLPGTSTAMKLHIAAMGDGPEIQRRGLQIGDEVELFHLPKEVTPANARHYPSQAAAYMLVGLDNILGVRTD
ncbi:MAG TPA: hypothetical protein VFU31_30495 [Candidatus Binatia bacterium]|nr:hypothetical protein [Candidatus Binatia bacterium]